MVSQNDSPYDPAVRVLLILADSLLDLLHSLAHFTLFKESECPVLMAVVVSREMELCLAADVYGLWVELVHIEKASKVVVNVLVLWVYSDALAPVLYSRVIQLELEVSETKVVLELCILLIQTFSLLKCFDCVLKLIIPVERVAQIEEPLE